MDKNQNPQTQRTALIAGATGLIGSACLDELLRNPLYKKVIAIVRRKTGVQHNKLEEIVVDFAQLSSANTGPVDDLFCCLGSTIKKAGSQEKFREIDYSYPLELARLAQQRGAQRMMLVSAVGADANSKVFYNRVKGELERDLQTLSLPELHIFQPSLLLGNRSEFRLGERVAEVVMKILQPFFRGAYAKYRAVKGETVARAMVSAALHPQRGVFVHEYTAIQELAGRIR